MTTARKNESHTNRDFVLTEDEQKDGWHFCPDWDGLLLDGDPESESGYCPLDCFAKDIWRQRNKIAPIIDAVFSWLSQRPIPVSVPILKRDDNDD
jgi:hypothetical protein